MTIAKILQLLVEEPNLVEIPPIPEEKASYMFEEKTFSTRSGYALNKAKPKWVPCFYYVNQNLLFGKSTHMSPQGLDAACKAVRREAVNWTLLLCERREESTYLESGEQT